MSFDEINLTDQLSIDELLGTNELSKCINRVFVISCPTLRVIVG